MTSTYCWRCKKIVPMLEEIEWEKIAPLFDLDIEDAKRMRGEGMSDDQIRANLNSRACNRYEAITGVHEPDVFTLWHHRRFVYGPDCPICGRPFRSAGSRYCAECGHGQNIQTA